MKNGLKLCARFAHKPNALNYCGRESAKDNIYNCIVNDKCDALEEEFQKFKGLDGYLKTISKKLHRDLYDYRSIEAYWIGNELLNEFDNQDFEILLEHFLINQVPQFFIDELREKFMKSGMNFIPHHAFNVLFVGVGNVTGSVEYNIENINNCIIRIGKVEEIEGEKLRVNSERLLKKNKSMHWEKSEEDFIYIKKFIPNLKTGDSVALHWKDVCKKLTKNETSNLKYWNNKVIDSFNKQAN